MTSPANLRPALAGGPGDRSEVGQEHRSSLRLQRLAGRLSSALIQLPGSDIDRALESTLREIVEALDVDRSSLMEFDETGSDIERVHAWARPGIPPVDRIRDPERIPWLIDRMRRGEVAILDSPESLPAEASSERAYADRVPIKSVLALPVSVGGTLTCAIFVGSFRRFRHWQPSTVAALRFVGEILAASIHRRRQAGVLERTQSEIARRQAELEPENAYLREEIRSIHGFHEIIGDSPALASALRQVQEVAPMDTTVLLLGETGTGKELFARALHERSARRDRALVRVNCAALPTTLIESELFGHERGAYTGAVATRQGRFELADRGSIFLDEIGDLPLELQAKLLRVLQEGEFERLGSSLTRRVDVRVIAATNATLESAVREGRFRADLFYRISVYPIVLPPLRERREDIPHLVWYFIHQRRRALRRPIDRVPSQVMRALQQYDWPGNVRELENVIERAMIRSTGASLVLDRALAIPAAPARARHVTETTATLEDVERRHIVEILGSCGWRINGAGNAADKLGLHPNTLRFRMKKLGIERPRSTQRHPTIASDEPTNGHNRR
ncbi:MAG TPA: sigma 54-interacting transcriptional regulator [Vicinamibacterales bacterium]|nr:sigma 54-interacting transcriptional regulator [Vicinamibacterales bacterium]